ncbi:type III-B CRISPR module RAMP protein Cmr1 [Chloroflexus sp.]|uniref:type III-B CRISPR module RAMP protein Cmr1 n=1 Tax=Chloroflexus sp. TaxID=1904827 RepID=UPI002619B506|nr:type III-B CRISPR module RAMP protein Cmr1 [uncultured Chloroflexus sp.]
MSRKPPVKEPSKLTLRPAAEMITEVREYSLITPLFGGGIDPASPDPITVVRAAEIRGQLRFWWRATRGGQFGADLKALRDAEEAIWGGPAREENGRSLGGQSSVQVVVRDWKNGTPDVPFEMAGNRLQPRGGSVVPAYAAFPLQPERAAQRPGLQIKPVYKDVRFTLVITFPKTYQNDVAAALWAWETFGGIGARTRRGFGALRLEKVNGTAAQNLPPCDDRQFGQWLTAQLNHHVAEGVWPAGIPHLNRQLRFKVVVGNSAIDVWHELINRLQSFRQQRRGMNGRLNRYGHSDCPEPNAIRLLFKRPPRGPHANRRIRKFPRAAFGLPIVFHMPHDPGLDVTLEGENLSRLASPLILKPVACRDGKAIGLAVILEGVQLPVPLVLKQDNRSVHEVQATLIQAEACQIPPLRVPPPNGCQPDVIQAFLDLL